MSLTTIDYENLGELNRPFFEEYKESFTKTLAGGWYILGNNVKEFEKAFAEYCGAKHCIGLASGLDALILGLKAFNFPAGSEVIVPSNTYIATILAILHAGLKPVLVEPDISTYNIDPDLLESAVTPRTAAIMPVHLYGKSCDMDGLMRVKEKYGLKMVEDCAQSHGARYKGKLTGTFGEFGAFSFYPTKNLGALGDAGAIITDNDDLAKTIRRLRNYGSDIKYYNELVGYNSRLDEVQAGFLSCKLKKLDGINNHKRMLADIYHEMIDGSRFIKPARHSDYYDVYHIYNIRHPRRDELKQFMADNGVKTDIHYPVAPHRQNAMQGIIDGNFPISDEIHKTTLSLPISYFHTAEDIKRVAETLNSFT